eukprot:SAG11_NODE_781_length_7193_cov_25.713561_2_plen_470_part_00
MSTTTPPVPAPRLALALMLLPLQLLGARTATTGTGGALAEAASAAIMMDKNTFYSDSDLGNAMEIHEAVRGLQFGLAALERGNLALREELEGRMVEIEGVNTELQRRMAGVEAQNVALELENVALREAVGEQRLLLLQHTRGGAAETHGEEDQVEMGQWEELRAVWRRAQDSADHSAWSSCSMRSCEDFGWPAKGRGGAHAVCAESDAGFACVEEATAIEAAAVCESAGARLCTAAEIEAGAGEGTGCGHNARLVWSSSVQSASSSLTCDANLERVAVPGDGYGQPSSCISLQANAAVRCCADASQCRCGAARASQVTAACCDNDGGHRLLQAGDGSSCEGGLPMSCAEACAPVFVAFHSECEGMLEAAGFDPWQTERLNEECLAVVSTDQVLTRHRYTCLTLIDRDPSIGKPSPGMGQHVFLQPLSLQGSQTSSILVRALVARGSGGGYSGGGACSVATTRPWRMGGH